MYTRRIIHYTCIIVIAFQHNCWSQPIPQPPPPPGQQQQHGPPMHGPPPQQIPPGQQPPHGQPPQMQPPPGQAPLQQPPPGHPGQPPHGQPPQGYGQPQEMPPPGQQHMHPPPQPGQPQFPGQQQPWHPGQQGPPHQQFPPGQHPPPGQQQMQPNPFMPPSPAEQTFPGHPELPEKISHGEASGEDESGDMHVLEPLTDEEEAQVDHEANELADEIAEAVVQFIEADEALAIENELNEVDESILDQSALLTDNISYNNGQSKIVDIFILLLLLSFIIYNLYILEMIFL